MSQIIEFTCSSRSREETIALGRRLGAFLKAGCVIGLTGDLGAGKTCFIKGIAEGLNNTPADEVTSPTFTILQEYPGTIPLYHFDAYRLCGSSDLDAVGFDDYVGTDGVAVIEWADRISDALPAEMIMISIGQVSENERCLCFTADAGNHCRILSLFKEAFRQ